MRVDKIPEALLEAGLTGSEVLVYMHTLSLGSAKASEIAQKAKVQRGSAYYSLKLLKEKGFVGEVVKSGVRYYSAAPPQRILESIEDEAARKKRAVESIIPQVQGLMRTAIVPPRVEVFEGPEGFKTVMARLLEREGESIRCMMSSSILEYLPQFHVQFRRRRTEKNIRIRTITQRTKSLEKIKESDRKELRDTRFLDDIFLDSNVLQYILDDSIIFIKATQSDQIAVWIEEKTFASLHQNAFDSLWTISQK